ncbi:MAG: UDP-4-amino-4,6-dideoxy-N-acetyl-beta-L-altrosamine N-acetyltransferase [Lachnospiraceae bacterium]|nr:UDP-4-amino-4,6-dideoxy-N-acetyl-beta-L-altrosamine N-acetyltransferase [Lachnospiraceae bacterium]
MLDGEKIYLLPISRKDTENVIRWRNEPYVQDKFIYREKFTKESHEKWLEAMVDTGKVTQFIIYTKAERKAIGSVYLRDINQKDKRAEFGIFIGEKEYWGKGFGNEATKLILNYAFRTLCLHKVMLRVFASNKRAIRSYEKAGFVQEGYFKDEVKIGNEYYDIIFMAILSNTYNKM